METKRIGSKIAEARKKINISQAELAEQLFISSQAVGKWERGESMPDITTFMRLAVIFGVDLNYFSENFASKIESPKEEFIAEVPKVEERKFEKKKMFWDMSQSNWKDADFSGLKNLSDKFSSSNIEKCLFIGSELSELLLKNNNVEHCDFRGSNIYKSKFQGSNLIDNLFNDCLLMETEYSGNNIEECDFSGADLSNAIFRTCSFEKNKMKNTILKDTSFLSSDLRDIVFEGTLEDCYFEHCDFTRVTFENCVIKNTFFKSKSIKKIRFVNCKTDRLTFEFLKSGKADLTDVSLLED